jgi:polysaccharide deacetylase family protein (PEP-CTERM system associated)
MLNALTIDVEDYFHTEAMTAAVSRDRWDSMPSRVQGSTEALLELLNKHRVKATLFFLGWVAERFPQLVALAVKQGHEIGCHSYWHRAVFRLDAESFREDTLRAKTAIEQAGAAAVVGYRAPSFSITPGSEWAIEVLASLGFIYDSSVNPIRHSFYGNHGASRLPYRREAGIWELPIATIRGFGQNLPCGGGAYLRLLPQRYFHVALSRLAKEGVPANFYLHPWEIDPEQPRLACGWKSSIRQYTGLRGTASKLSSLLSAYRFATIREAYASIFAAGAVRAGA